jgi:small subunit ribosomal protein S16
MPVRLRLSRTGKKHAPFYRIVAVDGRKKRDGAFLEDLGTYDALNSKLVTLHEERVNYWLSVGAVPTDVVKKIHKAHKKATGTSAVQEEKPKAAKKAPAKKVAKTAKKEAAE